MSKHVELEITNCSECPYSHWEGGTDHPYPTSDRLVCEQMGGKALLFFDFDNAIHPECPLADTVADERKIL